MLSTFEAYKELDKNVLDIPAVMDHNHSALSSSVYNLMQIFHEYSSSNCQCNLSYLDNNQLIKWESLDLPNISELYQSNSHVSNDTFETSSVGRKFKEATLVLARITNDIHDYLAPATTEQLQKWYVFPNRWLGDRFMKTFDSTILLLKSTNDVDNLLAVLVLTAAIERTLGDLFVSVSASTDRPRLLHDLLTSPELMKLFKPAAISCFYLLMGSPRGLNIRNLAWHGFLQPKEIPVQCLTMLIVVTASLKAALKDQEFAIRHLPLIDLQQLKVDYGFPTLSDKDCAFTKKLFQFSKIIPRNRLPIWISSIDHFLNGRYLSCLTLILPQFEHSLRILFAVVNHCPHRILTAENSTLYTTLTEMLTATLSTGTNNCLRQALSDNYLIFLMDLLMYPDGLRLRDRISHADVASESITKDIADTAIIAVILLCQKFCTLPDLGETNVGKFITTCDSYQSKHHPYSLIREEVKAILSRINSHYDLILGTGYDSLYAINQVKQHTDLCDHVDDNTNHQRALLYQLCHKMHLCIDQDKSICTEIIKKISDQIESHLKSSPSPLFRPRREQQVSGLLRAITLQSQSIIDNTLQADSVMRKLRDARQMRSRKRSNYQRFCQCLPMIWCYVCVTLLMVSSEWKQLNDSETHFEKLCRRLRAILCICENITSLTTCKKNEWDTALHTFSKIIYQSDS